MTVEDVKVRIGQAIEAAEEAKRLIVQLSDVATEAGGLALRTVRGSQCDYVKEGEHHLTAAIDEVERIFRRIDSCVEHAQAYRRALG